MRKIEPFLFSTVHIKCAPLDKACTHTNIFSTKYYTKCMNIPSTSFTSRGIFFEYFMHLNWSDRTPAQHSQTHTRCSSNNDNDNENKNWRRRRKNEILQQWVSEYFAAVLVSSNDPTTLRAPTNESALISHIVYVAFILMVRLQCVSSTSGIPCTRVVAFRICTRENIVEIKTKQK